ncbi:DEAD/DEAH box helicase [Lujinxingia sediminis]|uniref:DEAD/DEAH box helicase n=1 Tax=Lujinxingia sediminis TaxID=2480984 RepID=A0ABY0CSW8_9DELT|nr:DEAD/DEAH box helicase [Lujinxingia sediminis]RVU44716.1 DEAD/DEAH box helicase [Lujinxingia sediminis]
MTSWLIDAMGNDRFKRAEEEASRRRIGGALGLEPTFQVNDVELRQVVSLLELEVFDKLCGTNADELRQVCGKAFQISRVLPLDDERQSRGEQLLRLACLAMLGDRGADIRRILADESFDGLILNEEDWGARVWSLTLDTWLRLIRKAGWSDLDRVQENVACLRQEQGDGEPSYLNGLKSRGPAWQLVAEYHLAKVAEVLAVFLGQGETPTGTFDVREQLEPHFERALAACSRGHLMELELLVRLLERTAYVLVENSIWTVTRAVNSRVTKFVRHLVAKTQARPLFEMLPPQRRTLREQGLLGSGYRSVVVSLPTSSGKTLIAAFRILQALNQFDHERGWVAYLAPTRTLVRQVAVRLRRDFAQIGITVEQVSPALEVDGIEAIMLTDADRDRQFRVLVTTPEKLDLMLRGGWEEKIGRPLTLVVVDEAHNLADPHRGIKLELLLATINRECRFAQFLLLTPFIENAKQIAMWLDRESNYSVELTLDWTPNDRMIATAEREQGEERGAFQVKLNPVHTSRCTLAIPEDLTLPETRPLGMSWSKAKQRGALAAATAHQLKERGTVVVLAGTVPNCWSLARLFKVKENLRANVSEDVKLAQTFLRNEFGPDFPLIELLNYGVGIHNSGMSDDTKTLIEWLTERGQLDILVATTTIAQGVNFPVSAVVMGAHQYPYGQEMPPSDFWNLAGRAGRVDQGDLGIVAISAPTDEYRVKVETFIGNNVGALNSALIKMVQDVEEVNLRNLSSLAWKSEWSSFLQYLAHTYRQIGDHDQFVAQVEQVLRGTLGFRELKQTHPMLADQLLTGVHRYGASMRGQPLKLVDSTGFSLESVRYTLAQLKNAEIGPEVWASNIFGGPKPHLQSMMGVLISIPELKENFKDVLGGGGINGDEVARAVCDWVQGESIQSMANKYFDGNISKCCQQLFGKITQTASWGMAAIQTLTLLDDFDDMDEVEQRRVRNLPGRVYYGVNSDEALVLRLAGVPRTAAEGLARVLDVKPDMPLTEARSAVQSSSDAEWSQAMGPIGPTYRRVWSILEGEGELG